MDGWEATRQIRIWEVQTCDLCQKTNEPWCPHHRLPIVAVTADVMKGTHEMCFTSGMDDYITKVALNVTPIVWWSKWCFGMENKSTNLTVAVVLCCAATRSEAIAFPIGAVHKRRDGECTQPCQIDSYRSSILSVSRIILQRANSKSVALMYNRELQSMNDAQPQKG